MDMTEFCLFLEYLKMTAMFGRVLHILDSSVTAIEWTKKPLAMVLS